MVDDSKNTRFHRLKEPAVWLACACVGLLVVAVVLLVGRCSGHEEITPEAPQQNDTATIVTLVQQHSRLYSAEMSTHKTVRYTSQSKIGVTIAGTKHSFQLPLGKTEATIPVTVKYKAYIDLDRVTADNVSISADSTVRIVLPDPVIEQTSVSVDHDNETLHRQLLAAGLTDEQYQQLVTKAKDDAWNELSEQKQQEIIDVAKVSATDILIPQLHQLGFRRVEVSYRKDFSLKQLVRRRD